MGHIEHKRRAPAKVGCFILTVSDSRTFGSDESGDLIVESLRKKRHQIIGRSLVKDDITQIRRVVKKALADGQVQVIIINGGTGIAKRDCTIEAINPMLNKKLDGFGELFRYLSYRQIGSAAFLSRAMAGVSKGRIVISLPGSSNAVRLAMQRLILPELTHLASNAKLKTKV